MFSILALVIYFVIGGIVWYENWTRNREEALQMLDDPRAQVVMTVLAVIILWGGWPIIVTMDALTAIKKRKG